MQRDLTALHRTARHAKSTNIYTKFGIGQPDGRVFNEKVGRLSMADCIKLAQEAKDIGTVSALHQVHRANLGATAAPPQELQSTPKGGQSLLRSWEALRRR